MIVFDSALNGQTITLGGTALPDVAAGSLLTIGANDLSNTVTIDANSMSRILANQGTLTLNNLTLINGTTAIGGGATANDRSGGALLNLAGATLTVNGGAMNNNVADRAGGAIEDVSITGENTDDSVGVTLNDVSFSGNQAGSQMGGMGPGNGGVLHVSGSAGVDVNESSFTNNVATEGGALWNNGGTMTVTDSDFVDNTANGAAAENGGGAIYNDAGTVAVIDSRFDGNEADSDDNDGLSSGGAILANDNTTLDVENSAFTDNTSERAGGAIEVRSGTSTTLTRVTASENDAGANPGNGGVLHVTGDGDVTITGGTFANNSATEGGAFWNNQGAMAIDGAAIVNNEADGNDANQGGGGIYAEAAGMEGGDSGTLTLTDTRIAGNTASGTSGSGGGILLSPGVTANITGGTISGNSANRAGGGIENADATLVMSMVSLGGTRTEAGNDAGANPGNGGGLHIGGAGSATIDQTSVGYNTGVEGGGLWNSAGGALSVATSTIANNNAERGAGVYQTGSAISGDGISLSYVTVANNDGTGVASGGADIAVSNSLFNGNDRATDDNVVASEDDGNQIGDAGFNGAFRLYGGTTAVVPLGAMSAAIDTTTGCGDVDQRGAERPFDFADNGMNNCDVGAFELTDDSVLNVTPVALADVTDDGAGGVATVAAFTLTNGGSDSVTVGGFSGTIDREAQGASETDLGDADLSVFVDSNDNGQFDNGDMNIGSGSVDETGNRFSVSIADGAGRAISADDSQTYFLRLDIPGPGEMAVAAIKQLASQPLVAGGALLALLGLFSIGGMRRRSQLALIALALALTLTACSDDDNVDLGGANNAGDNNGGNDGGNDMDDPNNNIDGNQLRFVVDQLRPVDGAADTTLIVGDGLPVTGPSVTLNQDSQTTTN